MSASRPHRKYRPTIQTSDSQPAFTVKAFQQPTSPKHASTPSISSRTQAPPNSQNASTSTSSPSKSYSGTTGQIPSNPKTKHRSIPAAAIPSSSAFSNGSSHSSFTKLKFPTTHNPSPLARFPNLASDYRPLFSKNVLFIYCKSAYRCVESPSAWTITSSILTCILICINYNLQQYAEIRKQKHPHSRRFFKPKRVACNNTQKCPSKNTQADIRSGRSRS